MEMGQGVETGTGHGAHNFPVGIFLEGKYKI